MAISKVGAVWVVTQSGTSNGSVVLPSTSLTKGSFVVAGFNIKSTIGTPSIATVVDTASNVYAKIGSLAITLGANFGDIELWGGFITTAVTSTITASWGGVDLGAAVAQATQWNGVGGTSVAQATDQSITATQSGGTLTITGAQTTKLSNELVISWTLANGTPTLSSQAFTPAGTAFQVPETMSQTTGTDNIAGQMSETLSGGPAVQSYKATISTGILGMVLASFIPAQVGYWGTNPV